MTAAPSPESALCQPNGDLHVTDVQGRTAVLHWSRFHGLIVSSTSGAVYLGQPVVTAWLLEHLTAATVTTAEGRDLLQFLAANVDLARADGHHDKAERLAGMLATARALSR